MRTLFGHQSVGADLIVGLGELAQATGKAGFTIVESRTPTDLVDPLLCHFRVGRNHDAASKLADFQAVVDTCGHQFDLALFKFCYVDVTDDAQASALFESYFSIMRQIAQKFPGLKVGHVTMPLRAAPAPLNYFVNTVLLRRSHPEHARNRARELFNQKLRAAYGHEGLVFDLASIEARGISGKSGGWKQDGETVPALAPEFTEDGGHLNAAGRHAVAQAFCAWLALQS